MKPTLTYDSGYAQRLPSGDIEITSKTRGLTGIPPQYKLQHNGNIVIPKSDAELLARFILEGE